MFVSFHLHFPIFFGKVKTASKETSNKRIKWILTWESTNKYHRVFQWEVTYKMASIAYFWSTWFSPLCMASAAGGDLRCGSSSGRSCWPTMSSLSSSRPSTGEKLYLYYLHIKAGRPLLLKSALQDKIFNIGFDFIMRPCSARIRLFASLMRKTNGGVRPPPPPPSELDCSFSNDILIRSAKIPVEIGVLTSHSSIMQLQMTLLNLNVSLSVVNKE